MARLTKSMAAAERFRQSAAEQARCAAATTLPRVSERCLEAARSFLEMADWAEAVERDRQERATAVLPRPDACRPRRFGHA